MDELLTTKRGAIVRAGTLAALGLLLAIAPLALPAGDHLVGNGYGGPQTTPVAILGAVAQLGIVWLGCFVAFRRPENPIGWLLAAGGCLLQLDDAMQRYAGYSRLHGLAGANWALALEQHFWILAVGVLTIFIGLLFPTGRLLSQRWRWLARAAALGIALAYVSNTLVTQPSDYNAPGAVKPAVAQRSRLRHCRCSLRLIHSPAAVRASQPLSHWSCATDEEAERSDTRSAL